ncbi:hypothetical protein [Gracilimonas sp.]|uniref:hypothetical protein n=1 Tax=Gracilimonas sp. TaxID=1974203 RepID=UPI003BAB67F0
MPKKITADIPSPFRPKVLEALKASKHLIDKKAEEIWNDYSSRQDFHLWNPPPEHKKLTDHSSIIGALIVGVKKEIKNEENREYQAKRRKEKKNK